MKRYMTTVKIVFMHAVMAVVLAPAVAFSQDQKVSVGLGFDATVGKYGTDTTTTWVSAPLIIDYFPTDRLDFELVVPYVRQSTSNLTFSGGMPVGPGQWGGGSMFGAGMVGAMMGGSGGPGSVGSSTGVVESTTSQSGIGDVTLVAGYKIIVEKEWVPQVRPLAYVKFPTADERKGLGTGEFDVGGGIELSKWFSPWILAVKGLYVNQGSAPDFALKDYTTYQAGIGYQLNEHFRPSFIVDGASPPSHFSSERLEARIKINYDFSERSGVEIYALKGMTDASPDYGGGLAVFYDF